MGGRGAVSQGGLLGELLGIAKEGGERTTPSAGDAAGTNAARRRASYRRTVASRQQEKETGVALGR